MYRTKEEWINLAEKKQDNDLCDCIGYFMDEEKRLLEEYLKLQDEYIDLLKKYTDYLKRP